MRESWRALGAAAIAGLIVAAGACGRVPLLSAAQAIAPVGDAGILDAAPEASDAGPAVTDVADARPDAGDGGRQVRDATSDGPDAPTCVVPLAPVLSVIDDDEVLRFAAPGNGPIEIAALSAAAAPSTVEFHQATELPLKGLAGPTRVLARIPGCATILFDALYDVRATYAPAPPDEATTAVAHDDQRIVAWAQSVIAYAPGGGLTDPRWLMPSKALGPVGTDNLEVVVLGDGGRITLSFESPIVDGAGWDFAVFENTFANDQFLELAFVEVSSDGSRFARFDSAFRGPLTPCASCSGKATGIGGLAGAYRFGYGAPFDLAALRSAPLVRDGVVDLSAIRYVRIVDIVGDGATLDSFGRGIVDPGLGGPTSGFDLDAVGVLNQRP